MPEFIHLHNHTQFSLLDGASDIGTMMDKAKKDGMKGLALTDHGNMYGAFKFVAEAEKRGLKGIVGCEFYMVEDRHRKDFSRAKQEKDVRYHQLLLAKSQVGYRNISKLCSLGFIEGMYSKYPRIDKELLVQYKEGLIATSCCIGAEIPQAIMHGKLNRAEKLVQWWLDHFGEDFYIELQRHRGLENIDGLGISQEDINQQLIKYARKYNIKIIATNDAHYVDEDDNLAHDILLCVNTGQKMNEPDRFKFPSSDFYFKTQAEMNKLFIDVPEAIDNTMEIYDKVYMPKLKSDIMLPMYQMPKGFGTQAEYLRFLAYQGAKSPSRYGSLTPVVRERLDFELGIIGNMGFDGYFLIVQDFINAAREISVMVGPGRGSAAGSAVAFCLGITNIDPIKYNLLFERFLNPERVSMPDIDIDFDDYGRQEVIDWVVDKYGKNQVAQIITYGSMAAKSSIKDVARVMDLPLADSNRIASLVPDKPGTKLGKLFTKKREDLSEDYNADDMANIAALIEIADKGGEESDIIKLAVKLEGSVRNTGVHAAGVIIAPQDLTDCVPICIAKDSPLWLTQFDGSVVESAGMLKMDFLGLKTLSIIKDAINNIVLRYGEAARIDPDRIPLDDVKTFELFQRGETIALFQFESAGMQKYLKELKPTNIEDLIAMNALYRPGPMDYIPLFVDRKHGRVPIEYPHEWLEPILKDTYGIMVYQEQIMQTAQIMADFSLGQADLLRRAMGKKKKEEMEKQAAAFIAGATKKGVSEKQARDIFDIMEKFASYGFNRSHAAAYSLVAFQTAYLKAHYPAEYMASVLTHNKDATDKLNFMLQECKAQGLDVLGPDVNESQIFFTVNKKGQIRFGLSAVKGIGEGPVEKLLDIRKEGAFQNITDFAQRIHPQVANKKCLESFVYSGAFDCFGIERVQYFTNTDKDINFIDAISRYNSAFNKQQNNTTASLFGADSLSDLIEDLTPPKISKRWSLMEQLKFEKDVVGIYISGHPLDDYALEYKKFATPIIELEKFKGKEVSIAGIVTAMNHRTNQKGGGFGIATIEDYEGSLELAFFSDNYLKFKEYLNPDTVVHIKGKYLEHFRDKGKYELRVNEMRLLDGMGQEKIRQITLNIQIEQLDKNLIEQLDQLCQRHVGKQTLAVRLQSSRQNIALQYIAFRRQVQIDSLFVRELQRLGIDAQVA